MGWLYAIWESRIYVSHPELISLIIIFRSNNILDSLSFSFDRLCVPLNFISLQTLLVTMSMCKFYQYCCLEYVLNCIKILNRTKLLDNHKAGTSYNHSGFDTHYNLNVHLFCLCDFCRLCLEPLNLKSQISEHFFYSCY